MIYDTTSNHPTEICIWQEDRLISPLKHWQLASQLVVICDPTTKSLCYPKLAPLLPAHHWIEVPGKEDCKDLETLTLVWQKFHHLNLDRKSHIIILAGGSLLDLGGFAAATYLRGLAFDVIPTTLLAMVDASYGGKTGINFLGTKNLIGSFSAAKTVVLSPIWLETLEETAIQAGEAELLKHFLMADKNSFWSYINQPPTTSKALFDWVLKSLAIKIDIVRQDPLEQLNIRALLNLGHTIGHALESHFRDTDTALPHGLAIAAGIAIETQIAMDKSILSPPIGAQFLKAWLKKFPLPDLDQNQWQHLIPYLLKDKKNSGTTIRMALLYDIGAATFPVAVSIDDITKALQRLYDPTYLH